MKVTKNKCSAFKQGNNIDVVCISQFRFEFLVNFLSLFLYVYRCHVTTALPQFLCSMIEKWLLISHSHYIRSTQWRTYTHNQKEREEGDGNIKMFILVALDVEAIWVLPIKIFLNSSGNLFLSSLLHFCVSDIFISDCEQLWVDI